MYKIILAIFLSTFFILPITCKSGSNYNEYCSIRLSARLSVCRSVCPPLCMPTSLYAGRSVCLLVRLLDCDYLSVCLSTYLSLCFCPSTDIFVCMPVCLSVCLSAYLLTYLPACLSVRLSVSVWSTSSAFSPTMCDDGVMMGRCEGQAGKLS